VSRQFARGDDNNQHQPDGVNFLGAGEIPGYAVFSLNFDYKLDRGVQLFAKVANVFDRRYATAGALRQNFFPGGNLAAPNAGVNETFYAPGSPRALWSGSSSCPAGKSREAQQAEIDTRARLAVSCRQRLRRQSDAFSRTLAVLLVGLLGALPALAQRAKPAGFRTRRARTCSSRSVSSATRRRCGRTTAGSPWLGERPLQDGRTRRPLDRG